MPDPRAVLRALAGLAIALAAMGGISALAHLPVGAEPRGAALRLALRTARARIEVCRDRSAAELAALPAHMRQPRLCEETAVDYRLRLVLDGVVRADRRVTHSGIRRTRPLVVDELLPVAAGAHRLEVAFTPVDPPAAGAEALPRPTFEGTVDFPAGRIRLLALGADGALELRGAS